MHRQDLDAPVRDPRTETVSPTPHSLEPEETTDVVAQFLAAPGFRPGPIPEWASAFVEGPFLRTRPERDRGDGFFVAPLARATRAGPRSGGHR